MGSSVEEILRTHTARMNAIHEKGLELTKELAEVNVVLIHQQGSESTERSKAAIDSLLKKLEDQ